MQDYEIVIGLEVHVELKTKSKIFCGCETTFGGEPNTHCCPVCMGMPGTLPVLNEKVVEYAVKAGIATNCDITPHGKQDRKNYFYPDLPKAYQISQYDLPICHDGHIDIRIEDQVKRIGITRIHIEEDAGKLIHENDGTLIDYNRCGVPLIEIVSEPDLRSAKEVNAYLTKLRSILLFADVSDCKMNEGSFRCDVNLSIRKKGETTFGTRTEMKNLNSFAFITKAIESESQRQIKCIESGEAIVQETRRWDQAKGQSYAMRTKEDAHDYRYFPDPDLMPIVISSDYLDQMKKALPDLPEVLVSRFVSDYHLPLILAEQLVESKAMADYYTQSVSKGASPLTGAKLLSNDILALINKADDESIHLSIDQFVALVDTLESGQINASIAKKVLEGIWATEIMPLDYIAEKDLMPIKDYQTLVKVGQDILEKQPKIIADFLEGKEKVSQAFVGLMMRETKGKADPEVTMKVFKDLVKA